MLIPWQAAGAGPLAPGRGKTTSPARSVVISGDIRPCRTLVLARHVTIDPSAWPVADPARETGPPMLQPPPIAAVAGRRPHHRLIQGGAHWLHLNARGGKHG
jgi:hypothetical protein